MCLDLASNNKKDTDNLGFVIEKKLFGYLA